MSGRRGPTAVVGWLLFATLAGCGGPQEPEITPATLGADRLLYERGTAALEEGDWMRAREYFVQLRDGYPQSGLRADARLAVAETYEAEGSLESSVSAIASYQEFLSLYPTHERAAYAQYRLGMVYFNQMRAPDRDQTDTQNAIQEFERFIQRYPNSNLMPDVRTHLRLARDRRSESELIVGRYYYRRRWWPGAIDRLRSILDTDPGFSGRDAVYFYLGDALTRTNRLEDAQEAVELLERIPEEFPESEYLESGAEVLARARQRYAELSEQAQRAAQQSDAGPGDEAATSGSDPTSSR